MNEPFQQSSTEWLIVTARARFQLGQHDEAIRRFVHAALSGDPWILSELAGALMALGRLGEAKEILRASAYTGHPAILSNLALTYLINREFDLAAEVLKTNRLSPADPDEFAFERFVIEMSRGGSPRWEDCEAWRDVTPLDYPPYKPWKRGESLEGLTVLVRSELFPGDIIQFVRFLPLIKARYRCRVLFTCPEQLAALFRESRLGVDDIIVADTYARDLPPHDRDVMLWSLPFMLDLDARKIEPPVILAPHAHSPLPGDRDRYRVIIAYSGNPRNPLDPVRTCPLRYFEPLATIPEVALHGFPTQHLRKWYERPVDIAEGADFEVTELPIVDFAVSAGFLRAADLVVTVDTALAHLAGSLGIETWVILGHFSEWRWGNHPETSDWYPTVRLFRQTESGDWEGVMRRVSRELRLRVAGRRAVKCGPCGEWARVGPLRI